MEPTTRGEQAATPAWRWIWLAWLFPAVISTLQQVALYASRGALAREWPYAALQFPRMMAWALVTPLIFAAHRRWPLQRPGLARHIAIHAGLSTAISVVMESVWLPLTVAISARLNPGVPEPVGLSLYLIAFLGRLVPGALTYAAVLGVASTLQSREALRRRDVASEQLRGQLTAAQLHALKMQLQPHFLFNTLHAITVLIARDPAAATRMVARLGDLLRLTLSRAPRQEVTVAEELELVRHYLDIESVRFADRLTLRYEVEPATMAAAVPDLLLQPLVENAIKHGIASSTDAGEIVIRARRDSDALVIDVCNTGRRATAEAPELHRDGLGLAITRNRLQALYGAHQSFTLSLQASGGAIASVQLPWRLLATHA